MNSWIDIARWLAAGLGAMVLLGTLVVATLAWFLNHPAD